MTVGSGRPWQQQYDINTAQQDDIIKWCTGTPLPAGLSHSSVVVTKNRVFLLGGHSGSKAVSTVYTAPINADGTLGVWTTDTSLPRPLAASSAIVTRNRVYLLGGWTNAGSVPTVYTASIDADGTLGVWTTGTSLPGPLSHSSAIVTRNRVYLLGGYTKLDIVSTVYTASINDNGTLGAWTISAPLLRPLYASSVIVTKNKVFLFGNSDNPSLNLVIYTASINDDGMLSEWVSNGFLPIEVSYSSVVVTKNRVFLLGGYNGVDNISSVYTAPINADGTLCKWSLSAYLPMDGVSMSSVIVTKNRMFLLGGWKHTGPNSRVVYIIPFKSNVQDYSSYYNETILLTNTLTS